MSEGCHDHVTLLLSHTQIPMQPCQSARGLFLHTPKQTLAFQLESHLQVHSLQQQLQDLQQAADSSETAQQQLADQLREVSHDKSLLEQQLEAFMLEQASGSILAPSS